MFSKLHEVEERFFELEREMMVPEVAADPKRYREKAKEAADLRPLVECYQQYKKVVAELAENQEVLQGNDEELKELAQEELPGLTREKESLNKKLHFLLLPKDPNDEKNVVLEIRAGTGGDEAALFAADLFRMYSRYAEQQKWKIEILSQSFTGVGGFKEIIALLQGQRVYSRLKYESGVHRVQRVPTTESQGRIHTSAVTVAILPEADEVELDINPNDLRIDIYRSSGPGGQSVNTTDSAVRITHIPTGLVISCQDERSQHKNKAKGMKILKAKLLDLKQQEQHDLISADRRQQVGSGDRSERIRTYNFPQGRVTDHRIGLTLHRLDQVMAGDLDEVIDSLATHFQAEALKAGQE
ncbi:MAG: peptide chain release factor 1 [Deltaproteobacteria bacterium]|nr:peptide chain release factor 1 [Candidatus Anaeroferrophillus wilburensis]MBN2888645.1 peptide chain release factor 1 [Deltaproteobacteria bacterium]